MTDRVTRLRSIRPDDAASVSGSAARRRVRSWTSSSDPRCHTPGLVAAIRPWCDRVVVRQSTAAGSTRPGVDERHGSLRSAQDASDGIRCSSTQSGVMRSSAGPIRSPIRSVGAIRAGASRSRSGVKRSMARATRLVDRWLLRSRAPITTRLPDSAGITQRSTDWRRIATDEIAGYGLVGQLNLPCLADAAAQHVRIGGSAECGRCQPDLEGDRRVVPPNDPFHLGPCHVSTSFHRVAYDGDYPVTMPVDTSVVYGLL